jgi:hypothetical protein
MVLMFVKKGVIFCRFPHNEQFSVTFVIFFVKDKPILKIGNDKQETANTRPALFKNGRYLGAEFILQKAESWGAFG